MNTAAFSRLCPGYLRYAALGAPIPAAYGAWGMLRDVRPNVFTCGAAMLRIRRAFGAPMPVGIRLTRSPSAPGEWVYLKEGTVPHKNLGSPPPPPPPEDSPSGAPSPGRVGAVCAKDAFTCREQERPGDPRPSGLARVMSKALERASNIDIWQSSEKSPIICRALIF